MPDWTNEGGPGAGHDPKWGRRLTACLLIAVGIFVVLLKTGVIK